MKRFWSNSGNNPDSKVTTVGTQQGQMCNAKMFSQKSDSETRTELRQDPVTGKWVIISPQRAARPQEFDTRPRRIRHGPCPFCPGNEAMTPTAILIKHGPSGGSGPVSWKVRVIPNKYPALIDCQESLQQFGVYRARAGIGCHEVLIETPRHVQSLSELTSEEIRDSLEILIARLEILKKDKRLQYVMAFKNVGAAAGASIEHTHSQIMATPIIPDTITAELTGAREFFQRQERCVYCQMIQQELPHEDRVVFASQHFIVICPFASRFPFETWILPREHSWRFEETPGDLWDEFVQVSKETIGRIEKALPGVGYNMILHNAPLHDEVPFYHWHIEILPSTSRPAGFEWGSGVQINPVFPEFAAQSLREQGISSS